jgi:hypothetical protein
MRIHFPAVAIERDCTERWLPVPVRRRKGGWLDAAAVHKIKIKITALAFEKNEGLPQKKPLYHNLPLSEEFGCVFNEFATYIGIPRRELKFYYAPSLAEQPIRLKDDDSLQTLLNDENNKDRSSDTIKITCMDNE